MHKSILIAVAFAALTAVTCSATQVTHPDVPPLAQVQLTSGSPTPGSLDDPQLATVAENLRDGIEQRARVALDRTRSWEVRELARRMLASDPGVDVTLMNLAPRSSILSDEVTSDTTSDTNHLNAASIDRFDHDFLVAQTGALDRAAATLREVLIPDAKDPRLRKALFDTAAKVDADGRDARELLARTEPLTTPLPRR